MGPWLQPQCPVQGQYRDVLKGFEPSSTRILTLSSSHSRPTLLPTPAPGVSHRGRGSPGCG